MGSIWQGELVRLRAIEPGDWEAFMRFAYNTASLRLFTKLGFVEEGRRRRAEFLAGRYHDEVLLGITVEEFVAAHGLPEVDGPA